MNNTQVVNSKLSIHQNTLKNKLKKIISKNIVGWLILLPSVVLFAFYIWEPLVYGIKLSFFETRGYNAVNFIGLRNYIDIFSDSIFKKAVMNTVSYTLWSLLIGYLIPIIVAIILNEVIHFKGFFRFAVYFPNMVPGVANLLLWGFLFDPSQGGLLNAVLSTLKLPQSQWLQNPHLTIPLLVVTMTWKSFGATALVYLASLQDVNQELYEAATLDGAGIWARIRYVTIPCISNIAKLLLMMQIIAVFQVLYEPMVMTGGGPNNASISLMELNYNYAFIDVAVGKAAAVGATVGLILIVLTIIYLRLNKESETA